MSDQVMKLYQLLELFRDKLIENPSLKQIVLTDKGFVKDQQFLIDNHPKLSYITTILENITAEAEHVLIKLDGSINTAAHLELNKISNNRYWVGCGEKDSFGWLSGIIHCDEFHFCYG